MVLPLFAYANSVVESVNKTIKPESGVAESSLTLTSINAFSLDPKAPLSIKLLDYMWINRENIDNQKFIAAYLATRPVVSKNYEIAWKTARLVYFIGNYGYGEKMYLDSEEGAQLFNYGVKAGKLATELNAEGAEGYYWYAYCLNAYGRAKSVLATAAGADDSMPALRKADTLNATYEGYGANRLLGRYYQDIPVLLGGSEDKSLELIKSAANNAPQYRNNWVVLGQYYYHFGYYESAIQICQKALTLPNHDGKYEEIRYIREAKECTDKAKAKIAEN